MWLHKGIQLSRFLPSFHMRPRGINQCKQTPVIILLRLEIIASIASSLHGTNRKTYNLALASLGDEAIGLQNSI